METVKASLQLVYYMTVALATLIVVVVVSWGVGLLIGNIIKAIYG